MPGRQQLTVVACALLVVAFPAAAEAAKGKKKPKKIPAPVTVQGTDTTTTRGEIATAVATCPPGMIVTGGGFSNPVVPGPSGTSTHAVWESRRQGTTAWTVSALREDTDESGAPLALTAIANCRSSLLKAKGKKRKGKKKKGKGKTSVEAAKKKKGKKKRKKPKRLSIAEVGGTASAGPGASESGTATATCPAGQKAVGGGFSASPPASGSGMTASFPFFWQSKRNGDAGWQASALNASMAENRTIQAYAYCAARVSVSETSASSPIGASGGPTSLTPASATTPACPTNTHVAAGGFDNQQIALGMTAAPLMVESAPTGASWRGSAVNLSIAPGTITVKGYCF
jgi:hypothetical protein